MKYMFGDFVVDTESYSVTKFGEPIALEPQVFDLLSYLVRNSQKVLSRDELFDQVWTGKVISDTTLSGHIKSVRKALDDSGQKQNFIKTVHGRGYQFIASVRTDLNTKPSSLSIVEDAPSCFINKGPLVAVLPFQNMSSDQEQQYFAEGMSEDITTELSRFSDIQVVARHSAFQLKDATNATEYFKEKRYLNYLVEGKVRRSHQRVRINIQLTDASTSHTIWAEKYDRSVEHVFQMQDEIVETIVSTLSGQIQKVEMTRACNRATSNMRAYDHFLRGLSAHKNGYTSRNNFEIASQEFSKAVELDPNFARARAWLICATQNMWKLITKECVEEALNEAKYALSLDGAESEVHRILGAIYLWAREYELSGYHYQEARRLSPNDAHIAVKMGRYFAFTNQLKEALSLVRHAMFLNPLHPGWYFQELGVVYYSMDKFDTAIVTFQRNWELGAYDLAFIAACQVANNDIAAAQVSCQKALELEPNSSVNLFTQFETYQDIDKSKLLVERMLKAGFPA
ncbi:winged helix-turn-helix domain-containing tetratricopeptide repeat protein [Aliiglaciecola sp. SL4]|uniref:winged helix-turn-helix domain-containing tetratricopeptide repeat protein n=1 Tax=Aliiglaciecola sp. SL4 TaxID=3239806 RepID=UPI00355C5BFD